MSGGIREIAGFASDVSTDEERTNSEEEKTVSSKIEWKKLLHFHKRNVTWLVVEVVFEQRVCKEFRNRQMLVLILIYSFFIANLFESVPFSIKPKSQ